MTMTLGPLAVALRDATTDAGIETLLHPHGQAIELVHNEETIGVFMPLKGDATCAEFYIAGKPGSSTLAAMCDACDTLGLACPAHLEFRKHEVYGRIVSLMGAVRLPA